MNRETTVADRGRVETAMAEQLGSRREARWIAAEVLGVRGVADPVSDAERSQLEALTRRRRDGEPLQYVLGHWPFRTLDLLVDGRVLIPRPETEHLVDVALGVLAELRWARPGPVVADLGTGSGAIGLALAAEATGVAAPSAVWCCDASEDALAVARRNLEALRQRDAAAAAVVGLRGGDWWEALPGALVGRVQLVVSNPPYVSAAEWTELDAVVRCHEPRAALVAGDGRDATPGMAAVEDVLRGAPRWLDRPGTAVVEIAPAQAAAAQAFARQLGATAVRVAPDLAGRDRVLVATWR
ncbi:MAG TPA: peptide chain release factor N(5)-glutamine methyltransferase [Acidimicrobiales bacterium]|nr:peptide chain release factor N(5)-glutamine methyltransferase [Acidimicrobiales bacterium]